MFAVIESGSKQYLVKEGNTIQVELVELEEGKELNFEVLLVGNAKEVRVGKPFVAGAKVKSKVKGDVKGEKLIVFKYKPKKNSRTKNGHRQKYTELEIVKIEM
ncbi:50S ribosomal protein L21 [bacterium CG2_30_37_16]|nr:MAG: 50S ribosomal protein L21 [bacterium CG2_30_37_16]PIP31178.1 MAG: 50S ribosomal protein L21 [bacterium (Candidatus Howlettbacteria) CG23_combo_of_CG06-09_8_20_14_all_37_9]PIY00448.1 MAG: 50S ribosomal protein L21 [bacterium (Candidatus Howlettbacteria) CG_4_10_14_3_um_filter_37_10]PJB06508.1 MAG: 50S ribosomal protein L21 [bacterium (Candidatus Howlettbacteria) CG_4_9_14_3_um_filter_37_10]